MISELGVVVLLSETEKKMVIENYKQIMGDYKFRGPQNVTLELKHVLEREYSEYEEANTIDREVPHHITSPLGSMLFHLFFGIYYNHFGMDPYFSEHPN